jgi:hypothetical protein
MMENHKFRVVPISLVFTLCLILVLSLSLTSATESWGYGTADYSPQGNITNIYENNTYINQSNTFNDTQFNSTGVVNIKTSWLTSFINAVSKWSSYWTKTENINQTGYNITADYFIGDGSQLTGVNTGGDGLGNHTATENLNMSNYNITQADYIQTEIINFSGGIIYYNGTDNIWDFS